MSGNWLVLWAGSEASWGQLDPGGAFGPHVETGQVLSTLAVSATGVRGLGKLEELRDGEAAFDVTSELDLGGYSSTITPDPPSVVTASPSSSGSARPLLLPDGPGLVRIASEHVRRQLGGAQGVLAIPDAWQAHPWRGALLDSWVNAGWTIGSWEGRVAREAAGRRVIALAAAGWARVMEGGASALLPASAEAATAAALAPLVRARMLGALASAHGEALSVSAKESWFIESRLRSLLADGLTRRLDYVFVGGAAAPVFTFPGPNVEDRHVALASARLRVALPRNKDTDWWSGLAAPGVGAATWANSPTVFLGARAPERRLQLTFQMNGWPSTLVVPPSLPMFDAEGARASVVKVAPPAPPPAPPIPTPTPIIEDIALFLGVYRAGTFRLVRPHRGVHARVDGVPRTVQLHTRGDAAAAPEYRVELDVLPQGALVRVDFEPEPEA